MLSHRIIPTHQTFFLLLIIILVGSFLRLHKLTYQSLWIDELASWDHGNYATAKDVVINAVKPDLHPPGYHLLIHYILQAFGDSQTSLRLPSVIAGILSLPAMFFLTKRLYSNSEALIATAITAFAWAPIYYSQEARAYSLIFLLTIMSTHALINLTSSVKKAGHLTPLSTTIFVTTSTLSSYLHYYGFLILALHFLGSILYLKKTPKKILKLSLPFLFISLLHLPWLDILIFQFTNNGHKISWIQPPSIKIFPQFFKFLFNQSTYLSLTPLFLLFLYLTTWFRSHHNLIKMKKYHQLIFSKEILLILWLTLPISIAFSISHLLTPAVALRNLIVSAPAAYILLARSITTTKPKRLSILLSFLVPFLILYHLFYHQDYYIRFVKEEYRQTAAFVVRKQPKYPDSIIVSYSGKAAHYNYYFKNHFHTNLSISQNAYSLSDLPKIIKSIEASKPTYIFLLRAHRIPSQEFLNYFYSNFTQIDHLSYGGAAVWLFEIPKATQALEQL